MSVVGAGGKQQTNTRNERQNPRGRKGEVNKWKILRERDGPRWPGLAKKVRFVRKIAVAADGTGRAYSASEAADAKREILEQKPSGAGWRDFFKKVLRREELCHWNI